MTPVTDPDLLAQLEGSAGPRRPVSDPALLRELEGGAKPARGLSKPARAVEKPADPAEGMPWYEKAWVGFGGGARNLYLGAKDLVGQASPEERQERKDWSKAKEHLGGWGTAGQIAAETGLTLPVGGAVGSGAKVLTKAVPALAKVGSMGGRVFNLGLAGRGAAEGAISAGLVGDAEDETLKDRLDNALVGGAFGAAVPAVMAGGAAAARKVTQELSPSTKQATIRAYNALERTLGRDRLDDVIQQVENPTPSQLPRTTAAMSQDPKMGALERGARSRGTADFRPHDTAVANRTWELVKDATSQADQVAALTKGTQDIMSEGKALMDKFPLSQENRAKLSRGLLALRNTNEVIANPTLARDLDTAIAAMDNPQATLGVLPQLYWAMGEGAGNSTAIQSARNLIKEVADARTGGQFSNLQQGYGATMDQLKAAQAAQGIRSKFMGEMGFPDTKQYFGEAGQGATPVIRSSDLRHAVNRAEAGGIADLPAADKSKLGSIADQLTQHEIYEPYMATGATSLNLGAAEGLGSAALNAGPLWRLRGALGSTFRGLNERSLRAVDQAMLDPQAFLKMVEAKKALSRPLEPWERALEEAFRGGMRSATISTGE